MPGMNPRTPTSRNTAPTRAAAVWTGVRVRGEVPERTWVLSDMALLLSIADIRIGVGETFRYPRATVARVRPTPREGRAPGCGARHRLPARPSGYRCWDIRREEPPWTPSARSLESSPA